MTIGRLDFWAGPGVELITPQAATATIRFELADGLSWGADAPDPTEQCTSTPSSGECRASLEPITGRTGVGWAFNVVAARPGTYVLRAEIVQASDSDPNPANDTAMVTVVVTEPGTSGGGGGGSPVIRASPVRLTPARPRAGSVVVAFVRVTSGANPARPSAVRCAGTTGGSRLRGVARARAGSATCTYRTPRSARGKLLRGAVSFTADGQRITRRFQARLG